MRCKACDIEFTKYEVIWRKKHSKFEDLCRTCRRVVQETLASFSDNTNNRIPQDTIVYYEDAIEDSNNEGEYESENA